jgi:hypothetical protein
LISPIRLNKRSELDLIIFNRQREKIFYSGKFPFGDRGVEKTAEDSYDSL